ncbi:Hypothetical protein P9303_24241 [Prochlorococcus marinus str. MIT 9303]|uniref:Uncharacterized protein n=1 Tax=Prochlorococcus marinus (strain MIT 9303) TaxID=59922 RepID=A2CCE5_PROM3|nr:Hypothetical protein P9303_24241 [Prochlorococcus marinus str. MIT 9303]
MARSPFVDPLILLEQRPKGNHLALFRLLSNQLQTLLTLNFLRIPSSATLDFFPVCGLFSGFSTQPQNLQPKPSQRSQRHVTTLTQWWMP